MIRDRIKELRRVPARALRPNPRNWRTHPPQQRDALRGLLAEVGYAAALVARELPDGSLELIDGHLRAETTPDAVVPVLVLDVSEAEACKLLATFDPLSAMAQADANLLGELLSTVDTQNDAVRGVLTDLARDHDAAELTENQPGDEAVVPASFQIVVDCRDEAQQHSLYERLSGEGFACRVLTL